MSVSAEGRAEAVMQAEDLLLTVPEAATLLRLGKKTIYNMVATKTIPHVRFGTSIRFRKSTLEQWVAAKESPSPYLGRDDDGDLD